MEWLHKRCRVTDHAVSRTEAEESNPVRPRAFVPNAKDGVLSQITDPWPFDGDLGGHPADQVVDVHDHAQTHGTVR